jgi:hypothetical protein
MRECVARIAQAAGVKLTELGLPDDADALQIHKAASNEKLERQWDALALRVSDAITHMTMDDDPFGGATIPSTTLPTLAAGTKVVHTVTNNHGTVVRYDAERRVYMVRFRFGMTMRDQSIGEEYVEPLGTDAEPFTFDGPPRGAPPIPDVVLRTLHPVRRIIDPAYRKRHRGG